MKGKLKKYFIRIFVIFLISIIILDLSYANHKTYAGTIGNTDNFLTGKFDFNDKSTSDTSSINVLTGKFNINDTSTNTTSTVKGSKVSNCSTANASFANQYIISNLGSEYSYYFRYEGDNSEEVRSLISELAIEAPNNDNIGYSMEYDKRRTFDEELRKTSDNHPKNITNTCYADCSGAVFTILRAVGRILNMDSFSNLPVGTTSTMNNRSTLENAGFKKYRFNANELQPGDLLLRLKTEFPSHNYDHAVIFVGDSNGVSGSTGGGHGGLSWNSVDIDKTLINLDEQSFSFAGTPKTVTYEGETKFSIWLFSLISQFATYIISIIVNGIMTSIAGFGLLFESAINTAISHIEGNS